jgi:hypothetical protein
MQPYVILSGNGAGQINYIHLENKFIEVAN